MLAVVAGSPTVAEASTKTGARPVAGADPAQPPDHLGDVRAEDAAIDVALVDHDVPQPSEERLTTTRAEAGPRDAACPDSSGSKRELARTHSRSSQRRIAVEDRRPDVDRRQLRAARATGRRRAPWSGRSRARSLARSADESREHGQLVGQRLARTGAGRDDDVAATVGEIGGGGLVRPRPLDAPHGERVPEIRRRPRRPVGVRAGRGPGPVRRASGSPAAGQPAEQLLRVRAAGHAPHCPTDGQSSSNPADVDRPGRPSGGHQNEPRSGQPGNAPDASSSRKQIPDPASP